MIGISMIAQEKILDFIHRRFKQDCNWKTGNCYYFAVILATRFELDDPVIYYDTVDGHFLCRINNVFYDWSGAVAFSDEYVNKYIKKWADLYKEDPIWYSRIVRDVIL